MKDPATCTRSINANSSFPPLGAEENWKNHFTGKAAIASFPPLGAEETWKIQNTADESGAKAAIASFPPLTVEESWKMRV